jgi:hypothetical protein
VPRQDWGLRGCGYKSHSVGPVLLGLCASDHDSLYSLQLNQGLIVQALGEELQYTQTSLDAAHAFVVLIRAAASDEDMTVRR